MENLEYLYTIKVKSFTYDDKKTESIMPSVSLNEKTVAEVYYKIIILGNQYNVKDPLWYISIMPIIDRITHINKELSGLITMKGKNTKDALARIINILQNKGIQK